MRATLASHNDHKLREWRAALPDWELDLADVADFPPEEGPTYFDNARAKARFGSALRDGWVIGEDSGIEVEALDWRPGPESARWAEDGVAEILRLLDGSAARRARYVCEAVAVSAATERRGTGVLEGSIATERRGGQGFGYDPIFVPDGETRTVAELGDAWKAQNSHRARAARALAKAISAREEAVR